MAIEWYYINSYVAMGVDWQASVGTTTVSLTPKVYRWDQYNTSNSGGRYSETLSPDPVGAGSWSDLTFDSGSGERLLDTFATRTYNKGTGSVKLTLSWNSSFGSWYNGSFHTIGAGSHTWTYNLPAMPTYTITYNSNGSGQSNTTQSVTHGVSTAIKGTSTFSRTGYTLSGWNTAADGSGTAYTPGSSYSFTGNITLYAQWTAKTYTVTFETGEGASTIAPLTVTYDKVYGSLSLPKKTGYSFLGWFTAKENGVQIYGTTIMEKTSNHTLYAHWEPIVYSVSYNGNGATKGNTATSTHTYDTEQQLTPNGYARPGYDFIGWGYEPTPRAWAAIYDNTILVFGSGDEATGYNDLTLTKEWSWNSNATDINSLVITTRTDVPWNDYRSTITEVIVIDEIAPIDMSYWFYNCTSCRQMTLEKIDTSLVSSLFMAFAACTSLQAENSFLAYGWNLSNCRTMGYIFYGCSNITDLTSISSWTLGSIEDLSCAFYNCAAIRVLTLTNWNVSNCKNFGHMFRGCTNLTTVGNLQNWNLQNAKTAYSMFERCSSLNSVGSLSNWKVSNLENFNFMFNRCTALTSVGNISGWNTSSATGMQSMFAHCSALTGVNCSSWDVSSVTRYDGFNYNASGVTAPAFAAAASLMTLALDFETETPSGETIVIEDVLESVNGNPTPEYLFADQARVKNLTIANGKEISLFAVWKIAASIITLYLPNIDGIIEKRRGMMHMYNDEKNLCYAIMTIYDENRVGHLAN